MTAALPFLVIGLLVVALSFAVLIRAREAGHGFRDHFQDHEPTLSRLERDFPPGLANRLFGAEDWNFIVGLSSLSLRRVFLRQRRKLALSWVGSLRASAKKLMQSHVVVVRTSSQMRPIAELRVIADYFLFLMLCHLVALVIWLRGPVAMAGMVGYLDNLSGRLDEIFGRYLPAEVAREGNPNGSHFT